MEPDTLARRVPTLGKIGTKPNQLPRSSTSPAERRTSARGLPLHDLRHYAVSRLIDPRANIMLVARIAGHAKPSVTLDVYAHLFAEGIEEAARGSTRWLRGMKRRWGHAAAALSHMDGGNPRAGLL
jgi:integrase